MMTRENTESWRRLQELYKGAMERGPRERSAFLAEDRSADARLRARVQELVAAQEQSPSFLEEAGDRDGGAGVAADPAVDMVGRKLGHYRVRRVIASGGMGTVYEAIQEHPRRTVALKVMKPGIASRSALRRFEYESQLLGRLRHPGIAQIYDAGTQDDPAGGGTVPYFAMEYIPGAKTVIEYAAAKALGTAGRVELFAKVCDAVHHGHQRGIIHRDLKPANILVDSAEQPKVIDFGVARATDSDMAVTTLQTDVGELVGTLQYMSPEQCEADPNDLDTRSDVYALGVILYELLCGRLPYDMTRISVYEAARVVREQPPIRPSTVNRALRGDVETIALKALEKDRERRYRSAAELADDIRRYLRKEPIIARPPSVVYQLRMFAGRNKAVVSALVAVFVTLVLGIVGTKWQAIEASAQRDLARAEAAKNTAILGFLQRDMFGAIHPDIARGRDITVREILEKAADSIGTAFPEQPLLQASLHDTIGAVYHQLGLYDNAEPHLVSALRIRRAELGPDDSDTLGSMSALALLRYARNEFGPAEKLIRPVVEIGARVWGSEHRNTLKAKNILGVILLQQGRLDEAESRMLQTLEARRRVLGDNDLDTLTSAHNFAGLLISRRQFPGAEQLLRDTLSARRDALGDDHPDTLASMNNLASVLVDQTKLDEAEPLLHEALKAHRRVLGESHPKTLKLINNLGSLFVYGGRLAEAEPLMRESLQARRATLGDEDPGTLTAMNNLARVLHSLGRLSEAEPLLRDLVDAAERVLPEGRPKTYAMATFQGTYGDCLRDMQRYEQAELHLRQSHLGIEATLGAADEQTRKALEALIALYQVWGKPDQVAEWRERLQTAGLKPPSADP